MFRASVPIEFGGYALGASVPNVDHYLLPVIGVVVAVSLVPLAVEVLRSRRRAHTTAEPTGKDAA